jgi:hypothetical protein
MMERPGDAASVGRDRNDASVRTSRVMSGDKPKEAVQIDHGRKGGSGLCAGQRTGGGEDTTTTHRL